MHQYFIKTPWLVKQIFSSYIWSLPAKDGAVYLSFDDGPHPLITPWVLDELKKFGALATFFCIGNNVVQYPEVYERILDEGHAVGNHTFHHLNGWKTPVKKYLEDVSRASQIIDSNLFRPPYGRIKNEQARQISSAIGNADAKIIMWDVLSADFDSAYSPQQCYAHVEENVTAGSIVVFHDSEKAFENLKMVLPRTLQFLKASGYRLSKIGI
ncbi:MAG: polysaccharide deacetylase family protein [Flavisolibacter sp.]